MPRGRRYPVVLAVWRSALSADCAVSLGLGPAPQNSLRSLGASSVRTAAASQFTKRAKARPAPGRASQPPHNDASPTGHRLPRQRRVTGFRRIASQHRFSVVARPAEPATSFPPARGSPTWRNVRHEVDERAHAGRRLVPLRIDGVDVGGGCALFEHLSPAGRCAGSARCPTRRASGCRARPAPSSRRSRRRSCSEVPRTFTVSVRLRGAQAPHAVGFVALADADAVVLRQVVRRLRHAVARQVRGRCARAAGGWARSAARSPARRAARRIAG